MIKKFVVPLILLACARLHAKTETVTCQTSKGPLEIVLNRAWSPKGAERFLQLVDDGFYTHLPLFRCLDGFLCQFGAKPGFSKKYSAILDDPPLADQRHFKPGYVSFAGSGPNSRSTHLFIALAGAPSLGTQPWETPIGFVTEKTFQSTVKRFYTGYGSAPQVIESAEGENYLKSAFPKLDWFQSCKRN